jgi:glycosyltransferase involved in cell wall biosynthesis
VGDVINIAFIVDEIWGAHGGTEGQLLMLMEGLDRSRFNPRLLCLRDTEWLNENKGNLPVDVLGVHNFLSPGVLMKLVSFRKFCKEHDIDIVQIYFRDSYIFGAVAARLAGVRKVIVCRRNLGPGFWGDRKILVIFRALRRFATKFLANSRATRESIIEHEGIEPADVEVVYNGLESSRFERSDGVARSRTRRELGLDDSNVMIGMVSHLRKGKNFELFLDAALELRRKYPHLRFLILGEGIYRPNIENYIKKLGLDDIVCLKGAVEDVAPYLAAMDIACLTSDGESFSNAIIEYMAAGLPVVATAVGGNIEALEDVGFLFPPGDPEALVESLSNLVEDGELRRKTGMQSKEVVSERYGVDRMVSEYEAIYEEIMKGD